MSSYRIAIPVVTVVAALYLTVPQKAAQARAAGTKLEKSPSAPTLTGRKVIRDAFHLHVSFGLGGGPNNVGLFHAMEVGGTFKNGVTLALLHTFIYNKGFWGQRGGPNQFGGFLAEVKFPLYFHDLVGKVAVGPGGIRRASDNKALWSIAWYYGVDFHIPFVSRSGATIGFQVIHTVVRSRSYWGASASLGYTFF